VNPADFQDTSMGTVVPIAANLPGVSHAFVPAPLSTSFRWSPTLWPLLVKAAEALAALQAQGSQLPNPNLVLAPIKKLEAQKSSNLEGTYTEPELQALFHLHPDASGFGDDDANAFQEVENYSFALDQGLSLVGELPLSTRLIRRLHKTLLEGVRGHNKQPGEIRQVQVQIGQPARFVPPPPNEVANCLSDLEVHLNKEDRQIHNLVDAFICHYQFETIHPFKDGNGRVGRLLLALCIREWGGFDEQWLYLSPYFERNRDKYIECLYNVSSRGEWEDWLEFCFQGVIETSETTNHLCKDLLALRDRYLTLMRQDKGTNRLGWVIDKIFERLVILPKFIQDEFEVSYNTARSDIDKLVELKILVELPSAPQKTYYSPDVFGLIYNHR
jgi:Fic family protein